MPETDFTLLDACWRAANYLSVGHWGATPGPNFINALCVCGPGHGGPGMVANTYLEGTYSDFCPIDHRHYVNTGGEDMPEIKNRKWQNS